jgi:hypothetical protein
MRELDSPPRGSQAWTPRPEARSRPCVPGCDARAARSSVCLSVCLSVSSSSRSRCALVWPACQLLAGSWSRGRLFRRALQLERASGSERQRRHRDEPHTKAHKATTRVRQRSQGADTRGRGGGDEARGLSLHRVRGLSTSASGEISPWCRAGDATPNQVAMASVVACSLCTEVGTGCVRSARHLGTPGLHQRPPSLQ